MDTLQRTTTKIECRCEFCDRVVLRFPSQKSRFCSVKCRQGKKTKDGVVTLTCSTCAREFKRNRARLNKEHNYCSRVCADLPKPTLTPVDRGWVQNKCPHCSLTYFRPPSHAHKKFCSVQCVSAHKGRTTFERVDEHQRELTCKHCSKVFFRRRENAGYCTRECVILSQTGRARIPRTDPQQCNGCLLFKSLVEFSFIKSSKLRSLRCKECRNREGTTPEAKRRSHLRTKFGMSLEAWFALYDAQQGKCAICTVALPSKDLMLAPSRRRDNWTSRNWNTDHCHKTGKVRGILCRGCNTALGGLKDNPDTARAAAEYLERHRD